MLQEFFHRLLRPPAILKAEKALETRLDKNGTAAGAAGTPV